MKNLIGLKFDNTYSKLPNILLSKIRPEKVCKPKLIIKNDSLADELGLNFSNINEYELSLLFSGNVIPEDAETFAQAYAGHQFGHFTMLGDGRALILGEHITPSNKRFDIQFKGSGKTPYSRNGDGKAALSPMLREYIISEAMFNLKIPTTRSLAVVTTGEKVIREKDLTGAILTRVARSHLRVGTFQFVAVQSDLKTMKELIDYTIKRHFPSIIKDELPVLSLLKNVMMCQIDLIINWMRVGFIHGVMNTDNMSISGETIDYGPCAFMDTYNPNTVFSSIDLNGRYAFNNQPIIAQWNLLRFSECLLPFLNDDRNKAIKIAEDTINEFSDIFKKKWINMMCSKIGIEKNINTDEKLITDLLTLLEQYKIDYTLFFSNLSNFKKPQIQAFDSWFFQWDKRVERNKKNTKNIGNLMQKNNPRIIPRNYIIENVLKKAEMNDISYVIRLLKALKNPYQRDRNFVEFEKEPPKTNEKYKTFCGT